MLILNADTDKENTVKEMKWISKKIQQSEYQQQSNTTNSQVTLNEIQLICEQEILLVQPIQQ